jgi:hypothetical protein
MSSELVHTEDDSVLKLVWVGRNSVCKHILQVLGCGKIQSKILDGCGLQDMEVPNPRIPRQKACPGDTIQEYRATLCATLYSVLPIMLRAVTISSF